MKETSTNSFKTCMYSIGTRVNARIDPLKATVRFVQECRDGKTRTGTIQLELIRQMTIKTWTETIYWWNPEEFHIETKPNIKQGYLIQGQGDISIQFRALEGVESRARRFLSKGIEFKLDTNSRF